MPSFSHTLLPISLTGASAEPFDAEFCFITTRSRDPLCPVCQVRASACRAGCSARCGPFARVATPAVASPPCAPAFSPPFPPTFFTPRAPLFFQPRAFAVCLSGFLHAGVIGGLCRRAALPVRTLPPAGFARHSALLFHPSALRPSAWSRSRPSARMSTPPMVLFFERQLHAILSARAPVSLLNK